MSVIVTKRLMLAPHTDPKHLGIMVDWLNDPSVTRYSEQRHLVHSRASQKAYIDSFPHGIGFREILLHDEPIGTISARINNDNDIADVGILIGDRKHWGQGYGTEAWTAYCDHLLNTGIRKIEAGAMSLNRGMIHIFQKYKMFYEGRRIAHFLYDEDTVDVVYWGKFHD